MQVMDEIYTKNPGVHSGKPRHRAIAALVEGPRVLDFGCGAGDLLMILQDEHLDWLLVGMDISSVALDAARDQGFNGILLNSSRVLAGCYTTIVASQVLEHVQDDESAVAFFANALEDGGLLIVSVPNNGAVKSPDHKRDYTAESLRQLLSVIGEPELHSWPGEETRILMSVRKVQNDAI